MQLRTIVGEVGYIFTERGLPTMEILVFMFAAYLISSSLGNPSLAERSSPSSLSSRAAVDKESLSAIKRSISHDPFHALDSWNTMLPNSSSDHNHPHCKWLGISCSSKHPGRVVSLDLNQSSLQGTISPHIGNLSFLHYLDLSYNSFAGVIPPTIGNLHKLRVLDLSSNSLRGILPLQLGRLENLQFLSAYLNALSGSIPSSLPNCTKLTVIALSDNSLSGNIPKDIGSLTQLSYLNFGNNSLTGNIKESIQNLTSLETLALDDNQLGGTVPSWIGKLSKLKNMYLGTNNFGGSIPRSLVNCTSLEIVESTYNHLHGTLPSSLGMLQNMKELWLGKNNLKGSIPESLSNATHLRVIELSGNALQGTIPLSFGRLSALERFSTAYNQIESGIARGSHQPIPILQALSNCSDLRRLSLENNKLQGSLPSVLPIHLEELYLYQNQISGNIPPTIGNLSRLVTLSLFDNNIKGSIPPTIAFLKSLQALSLGNNLLEGTIPEEISSLSESLYEIYLSNNSLIGSIPKSIGQLSSLRHLYLNNNSFSGSIPHELGSCLLLEDLDLSFNNLSGKIPREVANLRNIQFGFNLSNNKLSGNVPPEIGGLQMALDIVLSNNSLSGQIGVHMSTWFNAEYINISLNSFNGNLSESFGRKQTGLKVIDLSYNNFSGRVPPALYNISALEILNFSNNNLEGSISCVGAFKRLNYSSFLHNHLLCGNCMRLPDCKDTSAKHPNSHFHKAKWFIIIAVVVGLSCTLPACYLLFFKKAKQKRLNMEEPHNDQFRMVSKEELVRATNSFSEANIIGTGSYGTVYSGVLESGEMIAVKIFKIENQQRSKASFMKECQTLGKVRHRNLTKIITVCCEDDFRALVFPLMTKGNLNDFLHERDMEGLLTPITLEMPTNIISELAGALSYLHHDCTPSIVHCDVKPENVLLDNNMTVKLTDFGIAKILGASLDSTTLSLRGSVGYIAPEYGVGGDATTKGDVYSFGVVILEVMTRRKPTDNMFSGNISISKWVSMALAEEDSKIENIMSIVEIANLSEENMKVIEELLKLGTICCSRDPHQRPTMREVENLLLIFSETGRIPNLEEILASMDTNKVQRPTESSYSSTFSS